MTDYYQDFRTAPVGSGAAAYGAEWTGDNGGWAVLASPPQIHTDYGLLDGILYLLSSNKSFKNGTATAWGTGQSKVGVVVRYVVVDGVIFCISAFVFGNTIYLRFYGNGSLVEFTQALTGTLPAKLAISLLVNNVSATDVSCSVTIYDADLLTDTLNPPAAVGTFQHTETFASGSPLLGIGAPGMGSYGGSSITQFKSEPASNILSAGTLTASVVAIKAAFLTLAGTSGGSAPYAYQEQKSTDGGTTWTDVAGSTTNAPKVMNLSAATTYLRRVKVTDADGNVAYSNALSFTTLPATARVILFWGDSNTFGTNTTVSIPARVVEKLRALGYTVVFINQGIFGSTAQAWAQTNAAAAKLVGDAIGATDIVIMLGTNDANNNVARTLAQYTADMGAVLDIALSIQSVLRVTINGIMYSPVQGIDTRAPGFNAALAGIVSSANTRNATQKVKLGNTSAYALILAHVAEYLSSDELHTNDLGAQVVGYAQGDDYDAAWASAVAVAFTQAHADALAAVASVLESVGGVTRFTSVALAAAADVVWNYATPDDTGQTPIGETVALTRLEAKAAKENGATLLGKFTDAVIGKITGAQQANAAVSLPSVVPTGYGGGLTSDQSSKLTDLWNRLTATRATLLDKLGLVQGVSDGVVGLLSMTEVVSNVRHFFASALALAPASSGGGSGGSGGSGGGRVPDINVTGYTLSKNTFWASAREMLAITVVASGGDYPSQMTTAGFFIGFTPVSQSSPPATSECIAVTPYPDGVNLQARLLVGTPEDLTAQTPTKSLAAGNYKVWLWIVTSAEVIINPVGQITVMA